MGFAAPVLALQKFRVLACLPLPPHAPLPPTVCVSVFFCLTVTWYNRKHCLNFIVWPDLFSISAHSCQGFVTIHLQVKFNSFSHVALSPFTYTLNLIHSVILFCHHSLTLLQHIQFQVNVALSPFTYNSSRSVLFCHHSLLHFKIVFSKENKGKVCIHSLIMFTAVFWFVNIFFFVTDWKCRPSEERTQPFPE